MNPKSFYPCNFVHAWGMTFVVIMRKSKDITPLSILEMINVVFGMVKVALRFGMQTGPGRLVVGIEEYEMRIFEMNYGEIR